MPEAVDLGLRSKRRTPSSGGLLSRKFSHSLPVKGPTRGLLAKATILREKTGPGRRGRRDREADATKDLTGQDPNRSARIRDSSLKLVIGSVYHGPMQVYLIVSGARTCSGP